MGRDRQRYFILSKYSFSRILKFSVSNLFHGFKAIATDNLDRRFLLECLFKAYC